MAIFIASLMAAGIAAIVAVERRANLVVWSLGTFVVVFVGVCAVHYAVA